MTQYSDVPEVNALYTECENIGVAMTMIDGGGGVVRMTVSWTPTDIATASTQGPPVLVHVPLPNSPSFLSSIRNWLVQREAEIDAELEALGVVDAQTRRQQPVGEPTP